MNSCNAPAPRIRIGAKMRAIAALVVANPGIPKREAARVVNPDCERAGYAVCTRAAERGLILERRVWGANRIDLYPPAD